jgi:GMP synthase (glutamine-hydrolysing)
MKPVCIAQNHPVESPGLIAEALEKKAVPLKVVRTFDRQALPRPREVRASIILGTPVSVRDYLKHDYLRRLFEFMAESVRFDIPVLGICFGGQMLANVMGARVEPNERKEIGVFKVRLTEGGAADPLFAGFEREFEVFQWHGDTFRVPHGATSLVEGVTCKNQAFRKGRSVAIQFHVEPKADEIPLWCDAYASELSEEKITKEAVVSAFNERRDYFERLTSRLIDNFLNKTFSAASTETN